MRSGNRVVGICGLFRFQLISRRHEPSGPDIVSRTLERRADARDNSTWHHLR